MATPTTYQSDGFPHFFFALRSKLDTQWIGNGPDVNPSPDLHGCCEPCYVLPALAERGTITKDYYNDKHRQIHVGLAPGDSFNFFLEKNESGAWIQKAALTTTAYGVKTNHGNKVVSFEVDWRKVLLGFDTGFYRLRIEGTGASTYTTYSVIFCLKDYNKYNADKTVRFEWALKGTMQDVTSYRRRVNYGDVKIPMQVRVMGQIDKMTAELEQTYIDYTDGEKLSDLVKVEINPQWQFIGGLYFYLLNRYLAFSAFIGHELTATDFNMKSHYLDTVRLPVQLSSGFSPDYKSTTRLSRVKLTFKDRKWDLGSEVC